MKSLFFAKSILITLLFCSLMGFSLLNSGGKQGYTGAPGSLGTCASCHSGGTGTTNITIQSTPPMLNNEYIPNTLYRMQISISNPNMNGFGFACEILDGNNANSGIMSNPGSGVQLVNAGQRRNATHSSTKSGSGSATFEFDWTSPSSGNATIYVGANAVNSNGTTSGDKPANTSITLTPANPSSFDKIIENHSFKIYPNPITDQFTLSTTFEISKISLYSLSGSSISIQVQRKRINEYNIDILDNLASGLYIVEIENTQNQKFYQKIYVK